MNTEKKPGKFQVIFRFLKGSFYLFVLSLVFSVLFTACNALTPQIIRYAVDHILTGVGDIFCFWRQGPFLWRRFCQESSTISAR